MVLNTLEVLAEGYTMASKTGIEASRVLELVQGKKIARNRTSADSSFCQIFSLPQCNSNHTYPITTNILLTASQIMPIIWRMAFSMVQQALPLTVV